MDLEELRTHLLAKPAAREEMPFGIHALVFKVDGRMFALIAWQATPLRITLKCDPDRALLLRDLFVSVQPGYHMNKRHWNTVTLNGEIGREDLWDMIDESYALVTGGRRGRR